MKAGRAAGLVGLVLAIVLNVAGAADYMLNVDAIVVDGTTDLPSTFSGGQVGQDQKKALTLWNDLAPELTTRYGETVGINLTFHSVPADTSDATKAAVERLGSQLALTSDVVFSPYSSTLTHVLAPKTANSIFTLASGASADDLFSLSSTDTKFRRYKYLIGLTAAASTYMHPLIELLRVSAQKQPLNITFVSAEHQSFPSAVCRGAAKQAELFGIPIVGNHLMNKTGENDFPALVKRLKAERSSSAVVVCSYCAEVPLLINATIAEQWLPGALVFTTCVNPGLPAEIEAVHPTPEPPPGQILSNYSWYLTGTSTWHEALIGDDYEETPRDLTHLFETDKPVLSPAERSVNSRGGTVPMPKYSPAVFADAFEAKYGSVPSYHAAASMAAAYTLQSAVALINMSMSTLTTGGGRLDRTKLANTLVGHVADLDEPSFFGRLAFNRFGQRMEPILTVQLNNRSNGRLSAAEMPANVTQIAAPFASQMQDYVYPMPSFDERIPFEYSWIFDRDAHWYETALGTIGIICAVGCILLIIFFIVNRKHKSLQYASPIFCAVSLCGCAVVFLLPSVWTIYATPTTCVLRMWFLYFGMMLFVSPIVVTTWRIYKILDNLRRKFKGQHVRTISLTWKALICRIAILCSPVVVMLSVITLYISPKLGEGMPGKEPGNTSFIHEGRDGPYSGRDTPDEMNLCIRNVRHSRANCFACPEWRQFAYRPNKDYTECKYIDWNENGGWGPMYYFIAACALWVGFTTMLALFFVLYGSSFPQDEAAADLMKNLDVKPVYFLVYNLTFFLMSLGFVLTYRSACGSEMYLREQEQTCYGVRSAGFIVVALMGVVMLYARKIVLVGFTMPKMKVKASKVKMFRTSVLATQGSGGSNGSGSGRASRLSNDKSSTVEGEGRVVCCCGMCVVEDDMVYEDEDEGPDSPAHGPATVPAAKAALMLATTGSGKKKAAQDGPKSSLRNLGDEEESSIQLSRITEEDSGEGASTGASSEHGAASEQKMAPNPLVAGQSLSIPFDDAAFPPQPNSPLTNDPNDADAYSLDGSD